MLVYQRVHCTLSYVSTPELLATWSWFLVSSSFCWGRASCDSHGRGDGKPEKVDWEGQRNQFDCAVEEGLQQVVPRPIFSSIVGTVICWCLKIGGAHTVAIWIRKGQNISKYDTAWYCIVFWGCPFSRQTDKLLDRLTDIRVFSVGELGAHFVARSHSSWHPQRRVGVTSK